MLFLCVFVTIVMIVFLLKRLLGWLDRRGYITYSGHVPTYGSLGNAALHLQTLIDPAKRHVIEMREAQEEDRDEDGEAGPDDPIRHLRARMRDVMNLPSPLDRIDEIRSLASGKQLAVFLDYDGTLSPIVERPELASLPGETRELVRQLASVATVAIVSGRDLRDVKDMVNLDEVYYAGSHGFEIVAPDGERLDADPGAEFLPILDLTEAELDEALAGIPGVQVERKRFSIAVHYRRVAPVDVDAVDQAVTRVADRHNRLHRSGGKKIHELQPRIDWHKGKAVLLLLERLDNVFPIYIGDDVTDENAFTALSGRGIGVVVMEEPRPTAASYRLKDTDEVVSFLKAVSGPTGQV